MSDLKKRLHRMIQCKIGFTKGMPPSDALETRCAASEAVALDLLREVEAREWIKCSERMPEHGTDVLCWAPSYSRVRAVEWDALERMWWIGDNYCRVEPTHWMPLPAPPKEDSNA